jgi:hypothetical protein
MFTLTKLNNLKLSRSLSYLGKRQFSWIPDGKERNDYQHKDFVPFNYDCHGKLWDKVKWPLLETGREQSPIALMRKPSENFEVIDFSDL